MKFHAISGLPRSASTLLCDVLNQNPGFHASSTSIIPGILSGVSNMLNTTEEFKTYLINDKAETERKVKDALKGVVTGWYGSVADKVIFDKSRGWSHNLLVLKTLFPDAKLIVTVRDLRGVLASIEKEHQKFPLLGDAAAPLEKSLFIRASNLFAPEGLLGMAIGGVEDLIRRNHPDVMIVRHEDFVGNPAQVMGMIYAHLGEPPFEHDFENIVGTAIDVDGLYLNKFPHDCRGKIAPPNSNDWRQHVPKDIAKEIMGKFQFYNNALGYE